MGKQVRISDALKGALIADASALGVHWIYDVDRIAKVAKANAGSASFVAVDEKNYENTKGYFAHGKRHEGANTQYGEVLRTAIAAMAANSGKFDVSDYQQRFANHFGPGGTYIGYIDRATRGTLRNIEDENLEPSGTDDVQLPAIAALPVIIALDAKNTLAASRVTNDNKIAQNGAKIFEKLLTLVLNGTELNEALEASKSVDADFEELITPALETENTDSVAYGEETGRACNLVMAIPLCFHILKNTSSYQEAVEANNLAGGDNAGRAILIGAVAGAYYGPSSDKDIPEDWIAKLADSTEIFDQIEQLAN